MKKNLALLVAIISIAFLFTACKKENGDDIKNITLNISINAGETYKLDLSKYGDADDVAIITKQASIFTTSEIVTIGAIGEYNFMKLGNPKTEGNLNEVVKIKVSEGKGRGWCGNGNGNSGIGEHKDERKHHIEETNITINITVL
jgi:hypothetical protein